MKIQHQALFLLCSAGFLFAAAPANKSPDKPFVITFFGSPTCEQCLEIKTQLLQPLEAEHAPKLQINYRNIEDTNDFKICILMEKGYKVKETAPQELFFPDTALVGYDAIMNSGKTLIESYLAHPEKGRYQHAYGNTTIDTVGPAQLLQQQKELDSICSSFAITSCNGLTIADGFKKKDKPCGMAVHLAEFARWMVFKGKTYEECNKDLTDRVNCLTSNQTFVIDEKNMPVAGDLNAPTTIVIYMSATCPLCKYLVSSLFDEVTAGQLKGKAKLIAKPFTQTVGDRALLAADSRFWDFVKALNARKERPDEKMVARIADSIGIAGPVKKSTEDAAIAKTLAQIHDEGVQNGVTVTPTIFLDGKRYRSYKDPRWVVDAVLCIQDK